MLGNSFISSTLIYHNCHLFQATSSKDWSQSVPSRHTYWLEFTLDISKLWRELFLIYEKLKLSTPSKKSWLRHCGTLNAEDSHLRFEAVEPTKPIKVIWIAKTSQHILTILYALNSSITISSQKTRHIDYKCVWNGCETWQCQNIWQNQ